MRRAVRVGLVVLGAAMAVYGAASLTGGWLGTPPWWERANEPDELSGWHLSNRFRVLTIEEVHRLVASGRALIEEFNVEDSPETLPQPHREWISGGVVAAGLALVAVGAWPRRRAGVAS